MAPAGEVNEYCATSGFAVAETDEFTSVTELDADFVESAALVAVTVTTADVTEEGEVYNPLELTVPTVSFPPETPFTDQFTLLLLLPVTFAVNCAVPLWPGPTTTDWGATEIESRVGAGELEDGGVLLLLPQAMNKPVSASDKARRHALVTVLDIS
jgi:hypothetical protein